MVYCNASHLHMRGYLMWGLLVQICLGLPEYLPEQVGPTRALSQLFAHITNNMGCQLHWISIHSRRPFFNDSSFDITSVNIMHVSPISVYYASIVTKKHDQNVYGDNRNIYLYNSSANMPYLVNIIQKE